MALVSTNKANARVSAVKTTCKSAAAESSGIDSADSFRMFAVVDMAAPQQLLLRWASHAFVEIILIPLTIFPVVTRIACVVVGRGERKVPV
jgi:hypothetical protein